MLRSWVTGFAGLFLAIGCSGRTLDRATSDSCDASGKCRDAGEACRPGEQKTTPDGCNSCSCSAGAWVCTELVCPQTECKEGETKGDGCNACSCLDGNWACTLIACGGPDAAPRQEEINLLDIRGLAHGAGRYVATGGVRSAASADEKGAIFTSEDGRTWKQSLAIGAPLAGVAFGNGVFVALATAAGALNGTPTVYLSRDGTTWTPGSLDAAVPQLQDWTAGGVAFGNGVFLLDVPPSLVLQSKDGSAWTVTPYPMSNDISSGIAFGASVFAVWSAHSAMVRTTATGDAFTEVNATGPSMHWIDHLFGNAAGFTSTTSFNCCFGETGGPWFGSVSSTDGTTWKFTDGQVAVPVLVDASACVRVGRGTVSTGKTCDTAVPVFEQNEFDPHAVLHDGPVYLVGGEPGIVASDDGIHFERALWLTAPKTLDR